MQNSFKSDSTDKTLSKGQQEYFKDSKVVDGKGNLLVVYHSTPNAFTHPINAHLTYKGAELVCYY